MTQKKRKNRKSATKVKTEGGDEDVSLLKPVKRPRASCKVASKQIKYEDSDVEASTSQHADIVNAEVDDDAVDTGDRPESDSELADIDSQPKNKRGRSKIAKAASHPEGKDIRKASKAKVCHILYPGQFMLTLCRLPS